MMRENKGSRKEKKGEKCRMILNNMTKTFFFSIQTEYDILKTTL